MSPNGNIANCSSPSSLHHGQSTSPHHQLVSVPQISDYPRISSRLGGCRSHAQRVSPCPSQATGKLPALHRQNHRHDLLADLGNNTLFLQRSTIRNSYLIHCPIKLPILCLMPLSTVRSRKMGMRHLFKISFFMISRAACTGWS